MRIIADQINRKVIVSHGGDVLTLEEVKEELKDAFSRVNDARSMELAQLTEAEVNNLYDAFLSANNRPNTLNKIDYHFENHRAAQALILKFHGWTGLSIVEKTGVDVLNIAANDSFSSAFYLLQKRGGASSNTGLFSQYLTINPK